MLFRRAGRFAKIEIRNGQNVGEYTLTFPFWPDRVAVSRLVPRGSLKPELAMSRVAIVQSHGGGSLLALALVVWRQAVSRL